MNTTTLDRPDPGAATGAAPGRPAVSEPVTVHRRRGALVLVGVGAAATAVAYLWRSLAGDAGPLGYAVALVLLPVAVVHLAGWWDARVPLLVADETGIRLRNGSTWSGLRWDEVDAVSLAPPRLPRRDARLDVTGTGGGRGLPLAMVDPGDLRALPDALRGLAPSAVDVVVAGPDSREDDQEEGERVESAAVEVPPAGTPDHPEPEIADEPQSPDTSTGPGVAAQLLRRWAALVTRRTRTSGDSGTPPDPASGGREHDDEELAVEPAAEPEPEPYPEPAQGSWRPRPGRVARAERLVDRSDETTDRVLRGHDPRTSQMVPLVVEDRPPGPDPEPAAGSPTPPGATPTQQQPAEPVIGPRLAEARRRLRLSVDDLAERTRIRPHVIDAVEADDFSVCGGDVYARGHLRVLARVLGTDGDALVAEYDRLYSAGPVTARRVFEAELAGPGRAMRPTSGGPRWSVLVGVVLVLVLVWGLARLLVPGVEPGADPGGAGARGDGRQSEGSSVPDPSATADRFAAMGDEPVPTRLRLAGVVGSEGASDVVVRTPDGDVLYQGSIGAGDVHELRLAGPAVVVADDAGMVTAAVDGRPTGPLGRAGERVRRTVGDG